MDEPVRLPDWIRQWAETAVPNHQPRLEETSNDQILRRAMRYLERCDPCISGQGGSRQAYKIACRLTKGFQLSVDWALDLIQRHYNHRCQPPWTEREWRHHLVRASQNGHSPDLLNPNSNGQPRNGRTLVQTPAKPKPRLLVTSFNNIECSSIEWVWPGWIPAGKLIILDGDPGLGKSTMLFDLAARVSRDGIMPDGSRGMVGKVLILSGEDDEADTIKPRLLAAGANEEKIFNVSHVIDDKGPRPVSLPADIDLLEELLEQDDYKLLIIDPLFAFLSGVDASKDQEVRRALMLLRDLAEKYRVALIMLRHLNKNTGTKSLYRGGGSIGIIGGARVGLLFAVHPDKPTWRVLACSKTNLASMPTSLECYLQLTPYQACEVRWAGSCSYTADKLLQEYSEDQKEAAEEKRSQFEEATRLLRFCLGHGPIAIKSVLLEANRAGIKAWTIRRAAVKLGLKTTYRDPLVGGQNSWSYADEAQEDQDGASGPNAVQEEDLGDGPPTPDAGEAIQVAN